MSPIACVMAMLQEGKVPQKMPSPDSALKDFFRDNEVFASLFNGYFFNNEQVIKADGLEVEDTAYAETIKVNYGKQKFKIEKINKYRDNVRRTMLGYFVILGVEDQSKVHYSMPIRKMLYDSLGYSSELSVLEDTQDKVEWTVDERLSGIKKGTKVTPIVTVVFYTGEEPWDGPQSLHDMMDMDERIGVLVPDYPLYVIDIGHDKDLSFNNKMLDELKNILYSIYSDTADWNETVVDNSTIALAGILSGDPNLYYTAIESKEGKQQVCKVLAERDERIRAEMCRSLAERDARIRAEMCRSLAERDARIRAEVLRESAEREEKIRMEMLRTSAEREEKIRTEALRASAEREEKIKAEALRASAEREERIRTEVFRESAEREEKIKAEVLRESAEREEKIRAEKDSEIAAKDAEIEELKRKLAGL